MSMPTSTSWIDCHARFAPPLLGVHSSNRRLDQALQEFGWHPRRRRRRAVMSKLLSRMPPRANEPSADASNTRRDDRLRHHTGFSPTSGRSAAPDGVTLTASSIRVPRFTDREVCSLTCCTPQVAWETSPASKSKRLISGHQLDACLDAITTSLSGLLAPKRTATSAIPLYAAQRGRANGTCRRLGKALACTCRPS
jgi:hypothetical protein